MFEQSAGKRTLLKRTYFPAGIALGAWFALNFLTDHLEWFGTGAGYRTTAFFLYLLLGLSIFFSGPIVYGALWLRGASLKERILGAYLVPLAWVFKEIWRVSEFFTLGEAFYYALSPLPFGVLTHQIGYLCLVEMLCRSRKKRRDPSTRILSPGPIVGLGVFILVVYLTLFWGVPAESPGTKWFYLYQEGYKALFGTAGHG
jgi:hypothetical protein